jgi:hypothetical protein
MLIRRGGDNPTGLVQFQIDLLLQAAYHPTVHLYYVVWLNGCGGVLNEMAVHTDSAVHDELEAYAARADASGGEEAKKGLHGCWKPLYVD